MGSNLQEISKEETPRLDWGWTVVKAIDIPEKDQNKYPAPKNPGTFYKKRMHQIELFIKYPNEVQIDILLNLIKSAKDTFIGKKYNFNSIKNYQNFSERVPVFSYEEFSD